MPIKIFPAVYLSKSVFPIFILIICLNESKLNSRFYENFKIRIEHHSTTLTFGKGT